MRYWLSDGWAEGALEPRTRRPRRQEDNLKSYGQDKDIRILGEVRCQKKLSRGLQTLYLATEGISQVGPYLMYICVVE